MCHDNKKPQRERSVGALINHLRSGLHFSTCFPLTEVNTEVLYFFKVTNLLLTIDKFFRLQQYVLLL
jgi:hypothetical protein